MPHLPQPQCQARYQLAITLPLPLTRARAVGITTVTIWFRESIQGKDNSGQGSDATPFEADLGDSNTV